MFYCFSAAVHFSKMLNTRYRGINWFKIHFNLYTNQFSINLLYYYI